MTADHNQAPAEGDAPFAWATFDGEGGFDLCLYDGNESHRDDYIKRNGPQFMSWVTPLYASKVQPKGTADLERQLDEVLKERDAASDYIDALLDEVLGTDRHEWTSNYGHADAMEEVRERMSTLLQPMVDRAWNRFESAIQAPAPAQGSWVRAEDVQRLARDLDVAINGEAGAAPAPQLCDVVAQAVGVMEARRAEFPVVARWTGDAKNAGPRARVWVQFEDGGAEVEFAPAALPCAAVAPLTDEQVMKLFIELNVACVTAEGPSEMFAVIVRAIERAHGIGSHVPVQPTGDANG